MNEFLIASNLGIDLFEFGHSWPLRLTENCADEWSVFSSFPTYRMIKRMRLIGLNGHSRFNAVSILRMRTESLRAIDRATGVEIARAFVSEQGVAETIKVHSESFALAGRENALRTCGDESA